MVPPHSVKLSMLPSRQNTCPKRNRVWYKVLLSSSARATEMGTRLYFLPSPIKTATLSGLLMTPFPSGPFCWRLLLKADFTVGGQTLRCKVKVTWKWQNCHKGGNMFYCSY